MGDVHMNWCGTRYEPVVQPTDRPLSPPLSPPIEWFPVHKMPDQWFEPSVVESTPDPEEDLPRRPPGDSFWALVVVTGGIWGLLHLAGKWVERRERDRRLARTLANDQRSIEVARRIFADRARRGAMKAPVPAPAVIWLQRFETQEAQLDHRHLAQVATWEDLPVASDRRQAEAINRDFLDPWKGIQMQWFSDGMPRHVSPHLDKSMRLYLQARITYYARLERRFRQPTEESDILWRCAAQELDVQLQARFQQTGQPQPSDLRPKT
jgi:hypothetical protein